MHKPEISHTDEGSQLRHLLRAITEVAWIAGFSLAALLMLTWGSAKTEHFVLAIIIAVVAALSDRLTLNLSFRGESMTVSPDLAPWIIGAVFLPTEIIMPAVLIAGLLQLVRADFEESSVLGELSNIGWLALSMGAASAIIEQVPFGSSDERFIISGAIAVLTFQFVYVGLGLAFIESQERGAAREHFSESMYVTGFEVSLPILATAVVGPFMDHPVRATVAMIVFQLGTWGGLRVLQSEQVHKAKSAFLRDTFSRYVPESVVDQLSDDQASVTLGGEERDITVMFVDIRGFTTWSENLAPAEIITHLNRLMSMITEGIFQTGGTLDKYTGDGLMAFWGAPAAQPDHADRAVAAAGIMLDQMRLFNEQAIAEGSDTLAIGIGIHSGPAIVGNVGHEKRLDFTAIGDTVNVSARIEGATRQVGCDALVSSDTYTRLEGNWELGPLERHGAINVKGRAEAVEVYILAYANDSIMPSTIDSEAEEAVLDSPAEEEAA